MTYADEYKYSINHPEEFWEEKAKDLNWFRAPKTILSKDANGIFRWFADGEMNTCYMALDANVKAGRGEQVAIYYDSPVTQTKKAISYQELLEKVALFAGALCAKGVKKGDRVLIYMPMIPEAVIAMLAVARLGAIHSVVFGGFAANAVEQQMKLRHDGQLDITIVTPDSLLSAFNNVLLIMTFAVAGIAAISLLVAGVLIMNMTLIGVAQRRAEIGLLKALGASSKEVRLLFITEATLLATSGAVLGMLIAPAR